MMESDPDTQIEVDIMILDYLLCIDIDTVLHDRAAKRQDQAENWVPNSVHTFRSVLSTDCTLPQDLRIKLQLLDFANIILHSYMQLVSCKTSAPGIFSHRGYNQANLENLAATNDQLQQPLHLPSASDSNSTRANVHLSKIIPEFMKLCTMAKEKVSVTRWVDIAAQFMMQAAAEEYHIHGSQPPETSNKCLTWELNDHSQALAWKQASARCKDYLQIQRETSLDAHLEAISSEMSLHRLESTVVDFLLDLMRTLEPPVLVQLERGQLGRLSRAETGQLRNRVGLR